MKQCPKCKDSKALNCFTNNKSRKDGHNSWCKDCVSISNKQRRTDNAQRFREYDRKYVAKYKETKGALWAERRRRFDNESTKNLTDNYLRGLLCKRTSLKYSDITDELIILKRTEIMLKRGIDNAKM